MSRIDEALKRAERDEPLDAATGGTIQPTAVPAPGLERFVAERTAAAPARETLRERSHKIVTTPHVVERRMRLDPLLQGKLVNTRDADPVSIEQYRRLAAVLDSTQVERGLKCLMVTSAFPREGKTLTTTNIALTLSDAYKRRVLLIDADFHRPCVHELLGLTNETGLAEVLRSPGAQVKPLYVSPTLAVVPAGHVNASPIAALSSDRMKEIIADAMSEFEWVLLDTPPVGLLTDAQLIARVTEGVLFVVAAGVTPYPLVQRTIADIGPERIIGMVLNRADRQALPAHDYYGQYYQSQP